MKKRITVVKNILQKNDNAAAENRKRAEAAGVKIINILSSPGSGKTTLLEKTIPMLQEAGYASAVIVGDLQTSRDADRLGDSGMEIVQVNTEGGCHLSATQVARAMDNIDLEEISILFIENVGNMVCPSAFDLGEHQRVALLSTPEGADKVAKYDKLFVTVDLVILNKIDLIEVLEYEKAQFYADMAVINSRAQIMETAARTGEGLEDWKTWLLAID